MSIFSLLFGIILCEQIKEERFMKVDCYEKNKADI